MSELDAALLARCSSCGRLRLCTLEMDPFELEEISEYDPPMTEELWCESCIEERRGDV